MAQKTLAEHIIADKRLMISIFILLIFNFWVIHKIYERMFTPSFIDVAQTFFVAREPKTLLVLNEHLIKLELLQDNIQEASFSDIQESINDTVHLINNVNKEMEAKNKIWDEIKEKIEFDKGTYDVLKTNLSEISTVTNAQMDAIKNTVIASYKPTIFDYIINYGISFVLGVIASIVAAKLIQKHKDKKKPS